MSDGRLTGLVLLLALAATGARADERLTLPAPEGWRPLYAMESALLRLSEFAVPRGDEVVDKVSFEWFSRALASERDPIEVADQLGAAVRAGCTDGSAQGVFAGYENGYPTAVRLFSCPRSADGGAGEVMLLKAIEGATGTWVIVRARRVEPFDDGGSGLSEAEIAAWSTSLRGITLCDPEAADHPCPAPDAPAREAPAP
jgi:hypothetical protein